MKLFRTPKLVAKVVAIKLLTGDRVTTLNARQVRVVNKMGFGYIRINIYGKLQYAISGANPHRIGEVEHNKSVDYYLGQLGHRTERRIRAGNVGYINAVKI